MWLPPFIVLQLLVAFVFGLPIGIAFERWRVRRCMKKICPDALDKLHAERKI